MVSKRGREIEESASTNKKAKNSSDSEVQENSSKKKQFYSKETHSAHVRDLIVPRPFSQGDSRFLKIISWNVAGLRAVVSKNMNILTELVRRHDPDILCIQETKLQNEEGFENILPGYRSFWTHSLKKKGYSGVAFFIKDTFSFEEMSVATAKKQSGILSHFVKKTENVEKNVQSNDSRSKIVSLTYEFEDPKFSGEGRTITVEFEKFFLVGCYVPNSGQSLERLDYRVEEWDPFIRSYLNQLKTKKPVIFLGDLNVGHLDLDIHNPEAKHIVKQAGLTPRERESMGKLLQEGFSDALRFLYPDARGCFTYWSQRTNARPVNKGIRLDYFICSNDLFGSIDQSSASTADEEIVSAEDTTTSVPLAPISQSDCPFPCVYDSYVLPNETVGCSDHCPVVLVLQVSK